MKNTIRWLIKKSIRQYRRHIRKDKLQPAGCPTLKNIAYFISGGIGDAIMAFPAIRFLKKVLPHAQITVFVPPDKYLLLSAVFEGFRVKPLNSLLAFLPTYRTFSRRFDAAFTNTISVFRLRVELAAYMSSRQAYGFRYQEEKREERLYTYTKAFPAPRHAADQNIQLISEALQISCADNELFLPAHKHDTVEQKTKNAVIHPGSETGYENKRWPVENFREIVKRMIQKGYEVTVLLGPSESNLRRFFDSIEGVRLLTQPDVSTLIDAFKEAVIFVGNDSGPAHLAAFYGVPQVTLFGPINPEISAPRGINSISLYNKTDCSPCHFTSVGCENNTCLQSITVEQVWHEVEKITRQAGL